MTGLAIMASGCQSPESEANQNGIEHRKSPIAIAAVNHMDTYIKVVYGQPNKRGRDIFGDLVPYNKVWRTGANEATEITFTKPVLFGGKPVQPGTYSLFTNPRPKQWTIILNRDLGLWGAFDYNSENDLLRLKAPAEHLEKPIETFTISFPDSVSGSNTSMIMKWDRTVIRIPVNFKPDLDS